MSRSGRGTAPASAWPGAGSIRMRATPSPDRGAREDRRRVTAFDVARLAEPGPGSETVSLAPALVRRGTH